jgi:hypothetical protein
LYPNEPRKIFYDVTESAVQDKFTILDALNILFIDLLTIKFDVDDIPMTNQLTFLNTHQETKDMSDTINVMKNRYQVLKPYHLDVLLQKVTVSMVNKDP